jgi:ATP-dependent DNA helicase DinG
MTSDAVYDPLSFFKKGEDSYSKHSFEYRPQQEKMALAVKAAFDHDEILIAEAGTGTGKTLAYLIPALQYAKKNNIKIIVSTETRNLQSQILESDVPTAEKILRTPIKALTAFGSSNYLCPRRLEREVEAGRIDIFMAEHLEPFLKWVDKDPEKILFYYNGYLSNEFRSKIHRDKDDCPNKRCRSFDVCPYYRAKEEWKKADLLLVNHSLLSYHVASDNQLLPEFSHLIVDEAHRFPEIYEQSSRMTLSIKEIQGFLKQMQLDISKKHSKLGDFIDKNAIADLGLFEREFHSAYLLMPGKTLRLREGISQKSFAQFSEDLLRIQSTLEPLATPDENEKKRADSSEEFTPADEEQQRLNFYYKKIKEYTRTVKTLLSDPLEKSVHWVSLSEKDSRPDPEFTVGRIGAGEEIKKLILDRMKSIVFSSATLTASGKNPFEFYLKELTAEKERTARTKLLLLQSPFDYKKNCILYLPSDMPDPGSDEKSFHKKSAEVIAALDGLSDGGMFVLFTSIRSLREIHGEMLRLNPKLEKRIISQNELGAKKALDQYHKTENAILLGLATFWQGIDIPGDRLRQVVLVRIPFKPPDDPITEALTEYEKKHGAIPFVTVQLPRAIIQIKQGFGRLIRTGKDRGAVTILDPRMNTKSYGKDILKSLPPAAIVRDRKEFDAAYSKIMGTESKSR